MYFVMTSLALVYLGFLGILTILGIPWHFIGIIAAIMLLVQYYGSDKLVLRSLGAKLKTPDEEPHLHAILDALVTKAGIPKPKLAIAVTDVPNAFATGRNPKNSVICITTGIRSRLSNEELTAVIGHELSHIKNRDVTVMTLASFFATVAGMLMGVLMWMSLIGGMGGRGRSSGGSSTAVFMIAYLVSVLVYFIATLLILALSRYREYGADHGGALLTGTPDELASALQKISGVIARIPSQDLRKLETANAFCIVSALKGESLAGLFASHPPLDKRVARLNQLQLEMNNER